MVFVVLATLTALLWMCYRASSLFKIPIPALVKLLGLDLPDPPRVSLHGIAADTITLHWSLPEKAGSVAKHIIQINGINGYKPSLPNIDRIGLTRVLPVGESEKRGETSVTVTGLNADHLYNVRVIAANSQNFQAPGQLIRLRTRRKSQASNEGAPLATGRDPSDDLPAIHGLPPAPEPQPPHHHHHHSAGNNNNNSSSNAGNHRRTAKERKGSPASLGQQGQPESPAEEQHTVESLTASLEIVRQEVAETDAQLVHTEEEFKAAEAVLRAELDLLKEKKNEEDLGRQKLRAETRALEEGKRASEATRSKTERALKSKEDEIKKMRNDSLRWDEERVAALRRVKELSKAAEESREHAQITERELQEKMKETQKAILEMEEEIRTHVGNIKALEAQRELWKAEEEAQSKKMAEDEQKEIMWKERQRHLEVRYITVYNAYQVAEIDYMRSREALLSSQSRRGSAGTDPIVLPAKKVKQRRNRNRKSRAQTISSPTGFVAPQDARFPDISAGSMSVGQTSVPFSGSMNPSPFFNIANGTMGAATESPVPALKASFPVGLDRMGGGAPMSPTANSLLPSNLFAFEDSPPSPKGSASFLEDGQSRHSGADPLGFIASQSPMSSGSVSTSHVSSPRSSFHHIPMFPNMSSDGSPGGAEHDNSISLLGSGLGQLGPSEEGSISGGRRFVKLFSGGFNRQRGKTIPLDSGPLLGSLKPNESHSFPKSPHPPGLDPIGTRRRSGSYGGWTAGLEFLHGGRKKPLERADSSSSRRSGFNHFSPSFDPIEPGKLFDTTVSPRPSSIASFDNLLPAPSSDVSAAFGWPAAPPAIEQPRNRVSLLGGRWSDFSSSRPSPGRPVSPNASTTTTTGLSLSHLPYQSARPATPRLNPAAPTFEAPAALKEENASSAISINTDTSNTSNVSDTPKDSLLSRFSALSKKGSTSKFNISSAWKKDGGFFSWKNKDSDVEDGEEGLVTSTMSTPLIGSAGGGGGGIGGVSPLPWKDKSGFFGRGKKNEDDDEEELKSGSGSGSGFFGTIGRRKVDKEDESSAIGEKEKEKEKREGLQGIFGRKKEKESGDEN
ncbi:unnamed protein product [Tuber aestivum]|uniref:Fibronectin type-III domain-containing protein n=1 Tax=Tuber aestivum TaxID=59557 RepID=A0A292Q6V8_9PEZI|nr:unnamed protein product [Tuber aestivum]